MGILSKIGIIPTVFSIGYILIRYLVYVFSGPTEESVMELITWILTFWVNASIPLDVLLLKYLGVIGVGIIILDKMFFDK